MWSENYIRPFTIGRPKRAGCEYAKYVQSYVDFDHGINSPETEKAVWRSDLRSISETVLCSAPCNHDVGKIVGRMVIRADQADIVLNLDCFLSAGCCFQGPDDAGDEFLDVFCRFL
ncbi:hypothetical protein U1Q18_049963 [Sarracenia purpurea var. burkii]